LGYNLIRNFDYFQIKSYIVFDLENYHIERAKVILEHFPKTNIDAKFQEMILLLELYTMIPDYEKGQLEKNILPIPRLK